MSGPKGGAGKIPVVTVFVAAGWHDRFLAAEYIRKFSQAVDGKPFRIVVEKDWTKMPGGDWEMSGRQRRKAADSLLSGIESADAVWLLAPREGGSGAWIEAGAAILLKRQGKNVPLVVSGDLWRRTIYTEYADAGFDRHENAFRHIVGKVAPEVAAGKNGGAEDAGLSAEGSAKAAGGAQRAKP